MSQSWLLLETFLVYKTDQNPSTPYRWLWCHLSVMLTCHHWTWLFPCFLSCFQYQTTLEQHCKSELGHIIAVHTRHRGLSLERKYTYGTVQSYNTTDHSLWCQALHHGLWGESQPFKMHWVSVADGDRWLAVSAQPITDHKEEVTLFLSCPYGLHTLYFKHMCGCVYSVLHIWSAHWHILKHLEWCWHGLQSRHDRMEHTFRKLAADIILCGISMPLDMIYTNTHKEHICISTHPHHSIHTQTQIHGLNKK